MSAPATVRRVGAAATRRLGLLGAVWRTRGPDLVVTVDDGPDADQTPRFLDVLAQRDARATFFVLGTRVGRYPDLLEEVVAAGHEVALHGPDHRPLTDFGYREARDRLRAARVDLEDRLGEPVPWYRPPYGAIGPTGAAAVRAAGMTPVLWSATTWDWREATDAERLTRALGGLRPGAVLLAHDGIAGAADGDVDRPAALVDRAGHLARVLDEAASRGLAMRALGVAVSAHGSERVRPLSRFGADM